MRNLATAWLLGVALTWPLFAAGAGHKVPSFQEKLQAHVATMDGADVRPIQLLIRTAFKYQLPFALEYVDRNAVEVKPRIKLPRSTVRGRIERLVGMLPGLKVSFSSGLIDVFSPAARADASNLLNVVLPQLKVVHLDPGLADAAVFGDLEAEERPGSGSGGSTAGVGGPPLTIDARNIRVYEALNRIVSEQGSSMWLVNVPPDKLSKLTGNLWQFHSFDSVLEQTVIERLLDLFPRVAHTSILMYAAPPRTSG